MRALALLALWLPLAAAGADNPVDAAPYVPSPDIVVTRILDIAKVGPKDFVVDLGSGDGRIVLSAALNYGARGLGVEMRPELVNSANATAVKMGVADRVKFIHADLFKTDISKATVVTMYLLPDTVNLVKGKLLNELQPGTRVVSHDYPLTGWIWEKYDQMDIEEKVKISGVTTTLIWLYIVPAMVDGKWIGQSSNESLSLILEQHINRVTGLASRNGKAMALEHVNLRGANLSFRLAGTKYLGQVSGSGMHGTIEGGGTWRVERAP